MIQTTPLFPASVSAVEVSTGFEDDYCVQAAAESGEIFHFRAAACRLPDGRVAVKTRGPTGEIRYQIWQPEAGQPLPSEAPAFTLDELRQRFFAS